MTRGEKKQEASRAGALPALFLFSWREAKSRVAYDFCERLGTRSFFFSVKSDTFVHAGVVRDVDEVARSCRQNWVADSLFAFVWCVRGTFSSFFPWKFVRLVILKTWKRAGFEILYSSYFFAKSAGANEAVYRVDELLLCILTGKRHLETILQRFSSILRIQIMTKSSKRRIFSLLTVFLYEFIQVIFTIINLICHYKSVCSFCKSMYYTK